MGKPLTNVARLNQLYLTVNVRTAPYFAKGDGITDDTAAIQAAIVACAAAGGGTVLVPPGTYLVTAALLLSSANVRIVGAGRIATKIKQATVSAKTIRITAQYCGVEGLAIEYASQGTAGGNAISVDGAFYSAIDDVYTYKASVGVEYRASANSHTLSRVVCEDCTTAGMLFSTAFNVMASSFQILNSSTALCSIGCIRLVDQVEGCNFFNGHTYQGAYSLVTDAAAYGLGTRPAYNKFHGIYFDAAPTCGLLDKAVEMDFTDCWFSARGNGIYLATADGIRFTGGGAINCNANGALVEATAKRVRFSNFAARGNSTAAANTSSGIVFAANATDFSVEGCTLCNDALSFGTQKHGVLVTAGTSDRYHIVNNLISSNGTSGVSDGGTGVNKTVSGNW